MGADFASSPALEALRVAKQQAGARVVLLSDSNSVFMSHLLAGAKAGPLVDKVLTNPASFERAAAGPAAVPGVGLGLGIPAAAAATGNPSVNSSSVGQKLVVKPRGSAALPAQHAAEAQGQSQQQQQGGQGGVQHRCCGACPASLCRGAEVAALKQRVAARRFVYCGDGAADMCAALALGSEDVVLARRGGALAKLAEEGAGAQAGCNGAAARAAGAGMRARVVLWSAVEELAEVVMQAMASGAGN